MASKVAWTRWSMFWLRARALVLAKGLLQRAKEVDAGGKIGKNEP